MPNRMTKGRGLFGSLTVNRDADIGGAATFFGPTVGLRARYVAHSADHDVTVAETGSVFANTKGSGTTVFSLPPTVAGLTYTFVELNAAGEITVRPVAADRIIGKGIAAADDKDYVNTGGTNAAGDLVTLVGDGDLGWVVVSERGTWARET